MTKVGLCISRMQPLHCGHIALLTAMASDCDVAIVGLGSTNQPVSVANPFPFEIRKEMIKNVFGNRFKIVPLADLGTDDSTTDWCNYVLDKLQKTGLPTPTDFYSGTLADALWYRNAFYHEHYRDYYAGGGPSGKMHIIERTNIPISATEVRKLIRMKDDNWKNLVPRVNHQIIEDNFPSELIIK